MLTTDQQNLSSSRQLHTYWLKLLIVTLLLLGIFFRFVNLERKVYWHDEAYTGLRISGYTKTEFVQQIFNGQILSVEAIRKYQYPSPEKNVTDTLFSLAIEDAQHPPLYYIMQRFWVQILGHSVAITRSLSAIASLLAFPCIYWLCWELFQSSSTGWIALGLLTISPFHVLYAQEARQFSLWTVTILSASAVLIRALRLQQRNPVQAYVCWSIYAVTLAMGLYTFLFSGLVAIAHGVYVFTLERFQLSKKVRAYLLATSAGCLLFLPWTLIILNNLSIIDKTTSSAQSRQSLSSLLTVWIGNTSYIFADFWRYKPFLPDLQIPGLIWGRYLIPFFILLVIFSLYFIFRHTQKSVWLFIFTLSGVPAAVLILHDVILGGKLSLRSRYVIPCYLGIELAVAYLLATQVIAPQLQKRRFWQFVMIGVISSGLLSCAIITQAETWWSKGSHANPKIARIVNQAQKPLLISSTYSFNIGDIMSLSHSLDAKVKIQLVQEPLLPQIPHDFDEIFLFNPSPKLRLDLAKEVLLKTVDKVERLWRLEQNL